MGANARQIVTLGLEVGATGSKLAKIGDIFGLDMDARLHKAQRGLCRPLQTIGYRRLFSQGPYLGKTMTSGTLHGKSLPRFGRSFGYPATILLTRLGVIAQAVMLVG